MEKIFIVFTAVFLCFNFSYAETIYPFKGKVTDDNVNIRSDSRVTSKVICVIKKEDTLEVLSETYDWYKIKLPDTAPAYVKRDFFECTNYLTTQVTETEKKSCVNAKAIKDKINIRLSPDEAAVILGRISKNEIINIYNEEKDWYRIAPSANSFGWIHKKFIKPYFTPMAITPSTAKTNKEKIVSEGLIQPYGKVFRRIATHKLMAKDGKIFLLKGDKRTLDNLNGHNAEITGELLISKEKYPLIEIIKIEIKD